MARPPRPEQLAALTRIRECMAEHGEEVGARLARADFPKIDKATWSRWCKQVREENAALAAQPMPVAPAAPVPANAEPLQAAEVVPVPGGMIDFFGQVGAMMAACDALQDYAWPRDPATGGRKVRNPMMLERATRLRATVLDLAHRRDEAAWNIARVRAFHAELGHAIGDVLKDAGDQELARRVIGTIRELVAAQEDQGRFLGAPVIREAE
ncbi:hypothetical protein [Burkholderia multivorans]|uniref:hypothetical protein n=1 Tax=Burkholderia multivorans TaxID=87883 RepID=UPI0019CF5723|nr:hypothetical protein [Burkholderia multivorans]MBN6729303.1 hypothetical protein [Burkholderia multivorans]MBN6737140.1 hypothetical protein [Burkholderia multivorans]MBN7125794.1 hypothetical protein [Burkholderia multivorans]MBN8167642.1 hypothetical protein [Burkholderia multivorans]QSL25407.1 hypothetical protein G0D92_09490 [Burkholderia multivorans]